MKAVEYAEKAGEIFVLSDSFIRIKELIDDEASTIDDIAEVILLDPALSGTLLKLANSSFFNYPGKIDTVSKAVLVLGITEVYNLVIAYFTTEAFKPINAEEAFLESFWQRSVDCALLIKFLGTSMNIPNAERLFILGLLHNLGELVVQQFDPDKVIACQSDDPQVLPWQKQQDILGFTYGECTAELLKLWQLPYSLIKPIRAQDDNEFDRSSSETQLLYLAKRVMIRNSFYPEQPYSIVFSDDMIELDDHILDAAVEYCDLERLGILSVLKPSSVMIY
ncbi:HDOD domain-containing protein [Thalassomonas viridans]|uniref:HDOD domain-containing protein n=1 Tax=Thalassomonas viridans TaxID=137584 RepID=A0AAE9Z154_9GAMM|nr:HDOD domain-containing protein [Thalassomonas viridans]WDE04911.1 HDOD domain-containing protein [Thalassomonas viridans]